jgi:hypothetical protein
MIKRYSYSVANEAMYEDENGPYVYYDDVKDYLPHENPNNSNIPETPYVEENIRRTYILDEIMSRLNYDARLSNETAIKAMTGILRESPFPDSDIAPSVDICSLFHWSSTEEGLNFWSNLDKHYGY